MTASSKKFINDPDKVVDEALEGLVASNPGLRLLWQHRVVYRYPLPSTVTLLSGGGAGHEPTHIGFVGPNLLTAAVSGSVFSSPSATHILAALHKISNPNGTLVIVKNYTGDRIQFSRAVERARSEGLKVEMVVVGDDCSGAGGEGMRRGLAGVCFVHKVVGAWAGRGASLEEVYQVAQHVAANIGTVNVALTPCTIPGAKEPAFMIGEGQMEVGLGIHGEAGVRRVPVLTAKKTAIMCLDTILQHEKYQPGDRVALLVNNLGGTTALELNILTINAVNYLQSRSVTPVRIYVGTLTTSLEMAGVSFTLLRLGGMDGLLEALDAEVGCNGWPRVVGSWDAGRNETEVEGEEHADEVKEWIVETDLGLTFLKILHSISTSLLQSCETLTNYDRITGDGDLGITVEQGVKKILSLIGDPHRFAKGVRVRIPADDIGAGCRVLSSALEGVMGGTFGGVVCLYLDILSANLSSASAPVTPLTLSTSLVTAIQTLSTHLSTPLGSRTLLDALLPATTAFHSSLQDSLPLQQALQNATKVAWEGAEKTKAMVGRKGRSAYLGEGVKGVPDPGAVAVAVGWDGVEKVFL